MPSEERTATRRVKYLFLDVVGFTHNRSVEAQSDIVKFLNGIIDGAVSDQRISHEDRLFLPTGDGVCIALLNEQAPFDAHLDLALSILSRIHGHNQIIEDTMRKFEVRIGINENVDNLITDINGNRNVAGAGINMAQRVMSQADAGQLLVGKIVYETLTYRERYMQAFRSYVARIKGGITIPVHQFIEQGHNGLCVVPPKAFTPPTSEEQPFTELEACYVGLALKHADFIRLHSGSGQRNYALVVLLWYLAVDTVDLIHSTSYEPPSPKIHGKEAATLESAFQYYESIDFWVCSDLTGFIMSQLPSVPRYAERMSGGIYFVVEDSGEKKLRREHPKIVQRLSL